MALAALEAGGLRRGKQRVLRKLIADDAIELTPQHERNRRAPPASSATPSLAQKSA